MEIKRLGKEDGKDYWELRLEALQKNPEAFLTSYQAAVEKKDPIQTIQSRLEAANNYTYGAYLADQLVGIVTMLRNEHAKTAHKADILAMYVSSEARRHNVGFQLIRKAQEEAYTIGIEQLELSVVAGNLPAKKLYEKAGFSRYGVEPNAIKENGEYMDEELMICFIDSPNPA
ncbi:GNAT family N-acetyltransferase [Sediminibacillus albus]|uniref:Ribosomal protein S18 acetylase RimI n=1 Tax=Sediminibacillus albus TaxID=407036 RepID=A0A1G8XGU4_9BACI|nr:GNAT family N-acetyltransferase [Sediminibacillus albus]SDJ89656.1 Ribosomal protein S18 acetylase RimI [Sediminibacillus albus]